MLIFSYLEIFPTWYVFYVHISLYKKDIVYTITEVMVTLILPRNMACK